MLERGLANFGQLGNIGNSVIVYVIGDANVVDKRVRITSECALH
jgi:hypothetical protein